MEDMALSEFLTTPFWEKLLSLISLTNERTVLVIVDQSDASIQVT